MWNIRQTHVCNISDLFSLSNFCTYLESLAEATAEQQDPQLPQSKGKHFRPQLPTHKHSLRTPTWWPGCFTDTNIHHRPDSPLEWWEACAVEAAWGLTTSRTDRIQLGMGDAPASSMAFLKWIYHFFSNIKVLNVCLSPNTGMQMKIIKMPLWSLPPRIPTACWCSVFPADEPGWVQMSPVGLAPWRWFEVWLLAAQACRVVHSVSSQSDSLVETSRSFSLQITPNALHSAMVLPRVIPYFFQYKIRVNPRMQTYCPHFRLRLLRRFLDRLLGIETFLKKIIKCT